MRQNYRRQNTATENGSMRQAATTTVLLRKQFVLRLAILFVILVPACCATRGATAASQTTTSLGILRQGDKFHTIRRLNSVGIYQDAFSSLKQKYTLFPPVDAAFANVSAATLTRLENATWNKHLRDLILYWAVPGVWLEQDFTTLLEHGPSSLISLNGEPVLVSAVYAKNHTLLMQGVVANLSKMPVSDGVVHPTMQLLAPISLTDSAYDLATRFGYVVQKSIIDKYCLVDTVSHAIQPLTAMYTADRFWARVNFTAHANLDRTTLENGLFSELLTCNTLAHKIGQQITSINGRKWLIAKGKSNNKPCFVSATADSTNQTNKLRTCLHRCDILVNNGVVHDLDNLLADAPLPTIAPAATTVSPSLQPSSLSLSPSMLSSKPSTTKRAPADTRTTTLAPTLQSAASIHPTRRAPLAVARTSDASSRLKSSCNHPLVAVAVVVVSVYWLL